MNNNFKYTVITLIGIAVFVIAQLAYSGRVKDEKKVTAVVTSVSEGGLEDIVVGLKDIRGIHYISKSNARGLEIEDLTKRLVNQKVDLTYIRPGIFTKMSPATESRLITRIAIQDSVIYSSSN